MLWVHRVVTQAHCDNYITIKNYFVLSFFSIHRRPILVMNVCSVNQSAPLAAYHSETLLIYVKKLLIVKTLI